MASQKVLPGILAPLAAEGVISLEQISEWSRSIERRTGQRVSPFAAVKEHVVDIDENDWIYAAHTSTRLPYHPIGDPSWLSPQDHSAQCLRHYEEHNGVVLYYVGRVIYVGMLDATQEACELFKSYYESWWQFKFHLIGPQDYVRIMSFLQEAELPAQRAKAEPLDEEDYPFLSDTDIAASYTYITGHSISPTELAFVHAEDIRDEQIIPLRKTGPIIWLGTKPEDWREQKRRRLRAILGLDPKPVFLEAETIEHFVPLCLKAKNYRDIPKAIQKGEVRHKISTTLADSESFIDGNAADIFHKILATGVAENASDIHLERGDLSTQVVLRIDGAPETFSPLDSRRGEELFAYIKQETGLYTKAPTGEGPADSNYSIGVDGRVMNLRLSSQSQQLNGRWHEKIVIRILDPKNVKHDLDETSLDPEDIKTLRAAIAEEKGIILVTGPTGSGKSTTLVALLSELTGRKARRSGKDCVVYTLEDPIEYQLTDKGIFQVQVDKDNNMGFGDSLRSLMRMDPDVILVQEIRDEETAKVAFDASDTGHLVMSTLHANSTINVFSRLIRGLKVPPEQVLNNLILATAQRLYPKRCPECRKQDEQGNWYNTGCIHCKNRGRKGRVVIVESLSFAKYPKARQMLLENAPEEAIAEQLRSEGWKSYMDQARELEKAGVLEII